MSLLSFRLPNFMKPSKNLEAFAADEEEVIPLHVNPRIVSPLSVCDNDEFPMENISYGISRAETSKIFARNQSEEIRSKLRMAQLDGKEIVATDKSTVLCANSSAKAMSAQIIQDLTRANRDQLEFEANVGVDDLFVSCKDKLAPNSDNQKTLGYEIPDYDSSYSSGYQISDYKSMYES